VEDPAEWVIAICPVIAHWLPLRDLTCLGSLGKSFPQTRPPLFCRGAQLTFPFLSRYYEDEKGSGNHFKHGRGTG